MVNSLVTLPGGLLVVQVSVALRQQFSLSTINPKNDGGLVQCLRLTHDALNFTFCFLYRRFSTFKFTKII